jgi:4-amino-4-deoxychorismate lyase
METGHSFHLFTSVRYDPLLLKSPENSLPILNYVTPSPFYMLIYHRDRMLEAAQHFDFHAVAQRLEDGVSLHQELLQEVAEYLRRGGQNVPLKVR